MEAVKRNIRVVMGSHVSEVWKPHQVYGRNVLWKEVGSRGYLVPLHCLHMTSGLFSYGLLNTFVNLHFWSYCMHSISLNYLYILEHWKEKANPIG